MNMKKCIALALTLCLLAVFAPAASAADDTVSAAFSDRWNPLLDRIDSFSDWLGGQTDRLPTELLETLRDLNADALFSDLKDLASRSRDLNDDALRSAVLTLAQKHGIHLVDSQVAQLMSLCRALEKLDAASLRERFAALEQVLDENVPGGLRGAWNAVVKAVTDAADWVARTVGGLFK